MTHACGSMTSKPEELQRPFAKYLNRNDNQLADRDG